MFAFVILHYLAEEMTCECVDQLIAQFGSEPIHIVVVDNGSANGSGAHLRDRYAGQELVTVLLNEQNLGFAQGNNIGYSWAKEHLSPDYMIIMNNDVLIEDADFLKKIAEIDAETAFHVLGPDIYACKEKRHQNPFRMKPYTLEELRLFVERQRNVLRNYPRFYCRNKLRQLKRKLLRRPPAPAAPRQEQRLINPVLHGACYIFSRKFIENEPIVFHPGTFLFFEEDILHFLCTQKGYSMVYDPGISIMHLEDVSTNKKFKSKYRRAKMKVENLEKSASILLELMEQDK